MAPLKCCVDGCTSTNETHRLYTMPRNDDVRALWLDFLVPVNSRLVHLEKSQLLNKRVCQKHFDRYQMDEKGNRLKGGYPSLFTEKEIEHGIPLSGNDCINDHSYCKSQETAELIEDCEEILGDPLVSKGNPVDHLYSRPATDAPDSPLPYTDPNTSMTSLQRAELIEANENSPLPLVPESTNLVHTMKRRQFMQRTPKILIRKKEDKNSGITKCKCFVRKLKNLATGQIRNPKPLLIRLNEARNLSRSRLFIKNFELMSHQAQDFVMMQLKMANRKKKARRYTKNEMLLSLSLMKESPKGYRLLQKIFNLPTKRTLNRVSENIQFAVGVNDSLFKLLEQKTQNWDTKKKLCSILFDEVALAPHLTYVESQDQIRGFQDFGYERDFKLCDHALVLMLKGICSNWRQPIAFYFTEGTTPAAVIVRILKDIVTKVTEANLKPLAVVCDQGPTNRTAISLLRKETIRKSILEGKQNNGTIDIAGQDISVVYDPPHLIKSIRNNWLNKDFIYEDKLATWRDIQSVYNTDCQLGHTRMNKKLTDRHIYSEKIKKMKVSLAVQALSATTSGMLKYTSLFKTTVTGENVSETMATTGEAVEFFDKLFDSVNGSPRNSTKGKLRGPIKQKTTHFDFWIDAKRILKKATFIDSNSAKALKNNKTYKVRVPCLDGWITSIESFERISKLLFEKYDVKYFYPRSINQDPLENFFGRIRAINYRNNNPDTNTFINAFKSLIMSSVMGPHSIYANCEAEDGNMVLNFFNTLIPHTKKKILDEDEKENSNVSDLNSKNTPCGSQILVTKEKENCNLALNAINERIRVHSSAYTAGYICRRVTKKFNCKPCSDSYSQKHKDLFHRWIQQREFNLLKRSNLTYPSKKFLIFYRDISEHIHNYLNQYGYKNNIKEKIMVQIIKNYNIQWLGCPKHKTALSKWLLNLVLRMQIHNWCHIINQIMKGCVHETHITKMARIHHMALQKYKSLRLRKRKNKE